MRRKQFAALLLAGVLAAGSLPGAVYAENESEVTTQAAEEEENSPQNSEAPTPTTTETSEDTPQSSESTAEDTKSDTNTETEDSDEENDGQNSTESQTPSPDENVSGQSDEEASPDVSESPTPSPEASEEESTVVDSFEKLLAAIEAAPAETPTEIEVTGTIEITQSLTIPANKDISLVPAAEQSTTLLRGKEFTGDLFAVPANASLTITGIDETYTFTIDGNGEKVLSAGSLIAIADNGSVTIGKNVILQNNKTTNTGGAIRSLGTLTLLGGTIQKNQAEYGGGICSNHPIVIGDETLTESVSLQIIDNQRTDETDDNIFLNTAESLICLQSPLTENSKLSFMVSDLTRQDALVVTENSDLDLTQYLSSQITLDANSTHELGTDGKLALLPTSTPTATPVPTATPTPTKVPTKTPTPTPTKAITKDALKIKQVSWVSRDRLQITFVNYLDKSGYAYYTVLPDGTKYTGLDTSGNGIPVAANGEVTFTIDNSGEDGELPDDEIFRVYLQVKYKDGNNTLSQVFPIKISQASRPTPTPNVTPTPTSRPSYNYAASDSIVDGLSDKIPAYAKKMHYFTVTGAGSDNTDPQEGDVKWEADYWKAGSQTHNKDRNGRFYMIFAKDYTAEKDITIKIHYTKYVYHNGQWQEAGEEDVPYTITVYPATAEDDPELTNGSGTIATAETLAAEGISVDSDAAISSNATTADETPVGELILMLFTALAACGIVLRLKAKRIRK
jgi:hypothetical protein